MCLVVALLFCSMSMTAQTTVYFGNLDKKVSVGVGMPRGFNQNVTFSIMQISKAKEFNTFSLSCVNRDGLELVGPVTFNMQLDTLYHLEIDGSYAHQIDYTMSRMDYMKMCSELNNTTTTVYVNNVEYTGAAFVGILRALEAEQNQMFSGAPMNVRNMTMWNFPSPTTRPNIPNIELMRFPNPNNRRDFRYIRRVDRNVAFPNPNIKKEQP